MMAMFTGGSAPGRGQPLIVFHGDSDPIVAVANAENLSRQPFRKGYAGAEGRPRTAAAVPASRRTARGRTPGPCMPTRTGGSSSRSGSCTAAAMPGPAATAGAGYTDPQGPDASAEMVRFFLGHRTRARA